MIQKNPEHSADIWLKAAYDVFIESGVECVKILTLAKRTGLTRTGFYWHFKDLNALLERLVLYWEEMNTGNLVARANAPARTVTAAMLNVFDCWHDNKLFDAPLDLAIRNWARNDPVLQSRLDLADKRRNDAMVDLFVRFGYDQKIAKVRSLTLLYTQIGYISMHVRDSAAQRFSRVPYYVEVFTGVKPNEAEIEDFYLRHKA